VETNTKAPRGHSVLSLRPDIPTQKRQPFGPSGVPLGVPVGVPLQAGTSSAPAVHRERGRPAAAQNWKEGPGTKPNGGASVLRTGGRPRRSFLPVRALRAADLLSLPGAPQLL
jgi:hypothetical protein